MRETREAKLRRELEAANNAVDATKSMPWGNEYKRAFNAAYDVARECERKLNGYLYRQGLKRRQEK